MLPFASWELGRGSAPTLVKVGLHANQGSGLPPAAAYLWLTVDLWAGFLLPCLQGLVFLTLDFSMQLFLQAFGRMKCGKFTLEIDFVYGVGKHESPFILPGTAYTRQPHRALFLVGCRKHLRWSGRSYWPVIRRSGSERCRHTMPRR